MKVDETCSCGAQITVQDSYSPLVSMQIERWRNAHTRCRERPVVGPIPGDGHLYLTRRGGDGSCISCGQQAHG